MVLTEHCWRCSKPSPGPQGKARVDMVKRLIFITFRKKLGLDLFAIIVHEGSISC
jgi:hypothetical protein